MPIYEYKCTEGHVTEHVRSYAKRDEPVACKCGAETVRLFPLPHVEPDGIYSYAPNIGSKERFEKQQEAMRSKVNVVDRT
jgi:putative FmdB family regulatory protein